MLRHAKKRVLIILPSPVFPVDPHEYIDRMLIAGRSPTLNMTRAEHFAKFAEVIGSIETVAHRTDATLFDPSAILCNVGHCRYESNGVSLYKDKSHLTIDGARLLTQGLMQALINAGPAAMRPQ